MTKAFIELGHAADFVNGVAFKPADWTEKGKRIIRIQNLTDGSKTFNRTLRAVPERFHVHPGDLLVSWSASLGVFVWTGPDIALLNQHIFRVTPNERHVDKRYLRYGLALALHEMRRHLHGATMQHVNRDEFLATRIYLPSLAEQRRIAAILDKADELRAKRRAALAQLDTLTQSIFLEMFGDPATNPKGWPMVGLKEHASKIGSGSTPLGGEASYKPSGIALIRSMNVRDGSFDGNGLAFIDEGQAARLDGVVVEADDVLLNITGASVARVCRAPIEVLPARVNQHVSIIRPTRTFLPRYLEGYLLFPSVKQRLLRIAGAGATREAITKTEIERFEVMRPPERLQRRFNDAMQKQDKFRRTQFVSQKELRALFASLQHRAFRGEL